MRKGLILFVCVLFSSSIALAQGIKLKVENDSTFNAAEDYANLSEGFDVDITKLNEINIGAQLAQDAAWVTANETEAISALANKSYYQQRADLNISSALPERTNIYTILSFIGSDFNTTSLVISSLEIEHFFNTNFKFRVGRLNNKVSESQFFGRIALEESSAHVFGRNIFINDAIEFDGSFKKRGGPSFFIGIKPYFNDLNLKAIYAGIHQSLKSGIQLSSILSMNRQLEADLKKYLPDHQGVQTYFSYEAEIAYKQPAGSVFLNVGGNLGFKGIVPHAGGRMNLLKGLAPVVGREGDSFKETFTMAGGARLRPSKLSSSLEFLPSAGLEMEVQGGLTSRYTALNVCAYCKINITKRMVLTYYCTPQFIWQDYNDERTSYIGGLSQFLRLSVTVGKPTRMFL